MLPHLAIIAHSPRFSWHSWDKQHSRLPAGGRPISFQGLQKPQLTAQHSPPALQNILCYDDALDLSSQHPDPRESAVLWNAFCQKVNPFVKLLFDWEIDRLRAATSLPHAQRHLSSQEYALVYSTYIISATSLSDSESLASFNRSRADLLSTFQLLCEQALARSDFFGSSEVILLQASAIYIVRGLLSVARIQTKALLVSGACSTKHSDSRVSDGHSHSPRRKTWSTTRWYSFQPIPC